MSNLVNNNSCLSRAHVLFFMTVGVNSDDLIGGDIVGSVSRGFDKIFDLFRSCKKCFSCNVLCDGYWNIS